MSDDKIKEQLENSHTIDKKKKIEEFKKKKKEETIKMILRQTDYDKKTAEEKLEQWGNNSILVIKEFMNPRFQEKTKIEKCKGVNQNVMGEIRHFMDDVNRQYTHRKRVSEHRQKQQAQFIWACKQKLAKQIEKVKETWPNAPDDCWKDIELQKLLLGYRGNGDFCEALYNKTFCDFHFIKK